MKEGYQRGSYLREYKTHGYDVEGEMRTIQESKKQHPRQQKPQHSFQLDVSPLMAYQTARGEDLNSTSRGLKGSTNMNMNMNMKREGRSGSKGERRWEESLQSVEGKSFQGRPGPPREKNQFDDMLNTYFAPLSGSTKSLLLGGPTATSTASSTTTKGNSERRAPSTRRGEKEHDKSMRSRITMALLKDDLERMGDRSPIRMKTPGRLRGESRDDGPPMQQRTSRGAYSPLRLQVPMTTRGPFPRTPKTPAQKVQQEHQALRDTLRGRMEHKTSPLKIFPKRSNLLLEEKNPPLQPATPGVRRAKTGGITLDPAALHPDRVGRGSPARWNLVHEIERNFPKSTAQGNEKMDTLLLPSQIPLTKIQEIRTVISETKQIVFDFFPYSYVEELGRLSAAIMEKLTSSKFYKKHYL